MITTIPGNSSDNPSLLVIEAGLSLIAYAAALAWPDFGGAWMRAAERWCGRLARRRGLSVAITGIVALSLRLAILPLSPIPAPFIHDEFANLLAADTFASGRLTNPTHPMWRYFETFHVTQLPTYMSMYFPAQGMVLAAGKLLTGNAWFGACLASGLMCAAICWMLQGWLPPTWSFVGGMLAVLHLALFSYWGNAYYGGAVPAIGGALVLGAMPRIMRNARVRDSIWLALGAAILANSRPYEGMLMSVPVFGALAWWAFRQSRFPNARLVRCAILPAVLLLVVAAMDGYYNQRLFGSPFTLPYQVNRATYASAPVFVFQQSRPAPDYRYQTMRDFYSKAEMNDYMDARTPAGFLEGWLRKAGVAVFFLFGFALLPPLVMLPRVVRDRRTRFLAMAGVVTVAGLSVNVWLFPHYMAPFTCGIYALYLQSMRHMRASRRGLAVARAIPLVCVCLVFIRIWAAPLGIAIPRWPSMWYGTEPLGLPRAGVVKDLESQPGEQLAIVRYAPGHAPFDDWVYNAADIDGSKVVWARETEDGDQTLLQYFSNRQVWLVEPDRNPPKISPWPRR